MIEEELKILKVAWIHVVSRLLERSIDVFVVHAVVQPHAKGFLNLRAIEICDEEVGYGRRAIFTTYVVRVAAAILVIRSLDIIAT
jgi:hypothetical protein